MRPYWIRGDAAPVRWEGTTLRALGHDETFLECVVAKDPQLLGLDPYETGVSGRVVSMRQARLTTPMGREIRPDVVVISESGHIVLVEAKLADNPELKDRRVVAQVVEYAASIANLTDDDALGWLGEDDDGSWIDAIRRWFPNTSQPDRLASVLRRRMQNAEIHLVIVTDGAPDGLRELTRAVAGQAALGEFQLHVVELKPYVVHGSDEVLLLPTTLARTEIVARTAITISYEAGVERPAVAVVASSPEEVEQAIAETQGGTLNEVLGAVVAAYDADAPADLRTHGRAVAYRQIRPPEWPSGIHYEFTLKGAGRVGVELHVESKQLLVASQALPALLANVQRSFPDAIHDPRWARGLGRLSVSMPASVPGEAARTMARFIEVTRASVGAVLASR